MFTVKPVYAAVLIAAATFSYADESGEIHSQAAEQQTELHTVHVKGKRISGIQAGPFAQGRKASDVVIKGEQLRYRSATLGNALADQPGVHSNPFGGGASAPIIRGQEGMRMMKAIRI